MKTLRCILISLACFLYGGVAAKADFFVVNLNFGAVAIPILPNSFGQFGFLFAADAGVSPIFRYSGEPQIFNAIVSPIDVDVIENLSLGNFPEVHFPNNAMHHQPPHIQTDNVITVRPSTSSHPSNFSPSLEGDVSNIGLEMASRPILPKQESVFVFKTLGKVLRTGNFLALHSRLNHTSVSNFSHIVIWLIEVVRADEVSEPCQLALFYTAPSFRPEKPRSLKFTSMVMAT